MVELSQQHGTLCTYKHEYQLRRHTETGVLRHHLIGEPGRDVSATTISQRCYFCLPLHHRVTVDNEYGFRECSVSFSGSETAEPLSLDIVPFLGLDVT